jgi:UDP-N-acetylmuramoylalanine--D-glutamate ligase
VRSSDAFVLPRWRKGERAAGIATEDLRKIDWSNALALLLAPGVPLTHPEPHWSVLLARKAGAEVIGDVELFCRERRRLAPRSPFVAITGTNGKSTTTALIHHLLKSAGRDVERIHPVRGRVVTRALSQLRHHSCGSRVPAAT